MSGLESIEDQMEEAALRYAERSVGTDMAPFIRYHLDVQLEAERMAVLKSQSPVWRLQQVNLNASPPVSPSEDVIVFT